MIPRGAALRDLFLFATKVHGRVVPINAAEAMHTATPPAHGDNQMTATQSRAELQHLFDEQQLLLADLQADNVRLRDAAIYDALTGLHSRAYLTRELSKSWGASCYDSLIGGARTASLSGSFAVIMVDIDNFKTVNDTHGHDVGDEMLKAVADVLGATARASDVVGRWGGEEFLVVMPSASEGAATHLARRMRTAIEAASIGEGQLVNPITVSVGVSGAGPLNPAQTPSAVVKRADEALYGAKANGRNCVEGNFVGHPQ